MAAFQRLIVLREACQSSHPDSHNVDPLGTQYSLPSMLTQQKVSHCIEDNSILQITGARVGFTQPAWSLKACPVRVHMHAKWRLIRFCYRG